MNYKLNISYNGSEFFGWCVQPNKRTVQLELTEAIKNIFKIENAAINASGRTDRYVHALNQVVNIKHKDLKITAQQLKNALNSYLGDDIHINNVSLVDDNFHARYSAKNKTYLYIINVGSYDVINTKTSYQYNKKLDINKMKEAANLLIGNHDFLSFSTSELNSTVRNVFDIDIYQENNLVFIKVTGDGFLRNMVRMICGCLIAYNENKIDKQEILRCLNNPKKGSIKYKLPGCGLYLYNVNY